MQDDLLDDAAGTKITGDKFRDGVARRFQRLWPAANHTVLAVLFLHFVSLVAIGIYVPEADRATYARRALVITFPFAILGRVVDDWRHRRRSQSDAWWAPCPQCRKALPLVIATWTCPHCGARLPGDPGKGKKQPLLDPDF
jgi:hypothetical protein